MRKSTIAISIAAALSAQALMSSTDANAASKVKPQNASGPVPNNQAQYKYPNNVHPNGSTVLYDQSGAAVNGVPAQEFQTDYDAYTAEGADDFVVTDAAGWNVSAFNFTVSFTAAPPPTITFDVNVYPDASGLPGATATCSYTAATGVITGGTAVSVALPSACSLPQGTYWVALQANVDFPPQMFWSNIGTAGLGSNAAWRNPGLGFGSGCAAWSDVTTCVGTGSPVGGGNPAYLFQVVGAVGGGGGDTCEAGEFCLDVTLGTDTTAGACGTVDTIDVSIGDQVNYCYTITNNTGISLDFHTLSDNIDGTIFSLLNEPVADGDTFQFNRVQTAGVTEVATASWTAQDVPPGYESEVTSGGGGITDRIFCDGFDGEACDPGGTGGFIDISTTGTALGLDDDGAAAVTMPFSFTLYGTTSNQLSVGNNGGILFGTASGGLVFGNAELPFAGLGPAILPLWDDFDAESGDVFWEAQGTAPNRKFIVEWFNRVHYDGASNTDGATFEVIFDEATQTLSFQYLDVAYTAIDNFGGADPVDCTNGVCATIGLQDSDTLANQFSFMEASITDNSGINWTPTSPQSFSDTDTTTVNVGAPDIDVTPTSVGGTVPEGGTTDLPLTIANIGNRDLVWTADEAPAPDSHFPPPGSRFAMPLGDPAHTSAGPAPRSNHGSNGKAGNGAVHAPLGGAVPAFSADVYNDNLVTFDFATPGTLTVVAADAYKLVGGAFIDGDLGTMWSIDGFNTSPNFNDLVTVNVATGAVTEVVSAPNSLGEGWTSLDYDATTGNLYGSSVTCGTASHLWTIDRVSGATAQVGEITGAACIIGIAVDPTGLMYGLDIVSDALFAIDKTTGNASLIGSLGFNAGYAQDMTFDQATGILYLTAFDQGAGQGAAFTVDVATGQATLIAPFGGGGGLFELDAVAILTAGGPCSQPADQPWLTITPAGGTTAPGGSTPVSLGIDPGAAVDGDTLVGTVCVTSNDPDEHVVEIPVTVDVEAGGGNPNIIDSGVVNLDVPASFDGLYLNWLNGATCTAACTAANFMFNPFGTTALQFFWPSGGGTATQTGGVGAASVYSVLTSGALIGPASTYVNSTASTATATWRAGASGYLGFRFLNSGTATVNYGYAQMTTTATSGFPATIVRYVYDNSGAAITIP